MDSYGQYQWWISHLPSTNPPVSVVQPQLVQRGKIPWGKSHGENPWWESPKKIRGVLNGCSLCCAWKLKKGKMCHGCFNPSFFCSPSYISFTCSRHPPFACLIPSLTFNFCLSFSLSFLEAPSSTNIWMAFARIITGMEPRRRPKGQWGSSSLLKFQAAARIYHASIYNNNLIIYIIHSYYIYNYIYIYIWCFTRWNSLCKVTFEETPSGFWSAQTHLKNQLGVAENCVFFHG